jgi:hypothetical protein
MKELIREELDKLKTKIKNKASGGPTAATWDRVERLARILRDLEAADASSRQ